MLKKALVHQIDDAATGGAAVKQGRRAAQDFELLGKHRLGSHSVVGAHGGDIQGADAIFHDADPTAALPANHGTTRPRAKIANGDPQLPRQSFPNIADVAGPQRLLGQDLDGLRQVSGGLS